MKYRAFGFAGIAVAICAVPAFAHHSFAMFEGEKTVTLTGTVKAFQWIYPHSWILLMVPNSEGQLEQWPIERPISSPRNARTHSDAQARASQVMDVRSM